MPTLMCITRTGVSNTPFRSSKTMEHARIRAKVVCSALSLILAIGVSYAIPIMPPVYNQQDVGCCQWMACTGCIHVKTGVHLSALCGYYFDRCWQGQPTVDCGSDSQNAIFITQTVGVCQDALMPFVDAILDSSGKPLAPPFPDGLRDAADHKLPNSNWLGCETPLDVESAIKSGDGRTSVMYDSEVSADIWSYQPGKVLGAPDMNNIVGGHATVVVGVLYSWADTANYPDIFGVNPPRPVMADGTPYQDGTRLWIVRNSWGADWGYNGHLLCPDGFLFNDTALGTHFALMQAA